MTTPNAALEPQPPASEPCGCPMCRDDLQPDATAYSYAQTAALLRFCQASKHAAYRWRRKNSRHMRLITRRLVAATVSPIALTVMSAVERDMLHRAAEVMSALSKHAEPAKSHARYSTAASDARNICHRVAWRAWRRAAADAEAARKGAEDGRRFAALARSHPLVLARALAQVHDGLSARDGEAGGAGA